MQVYNYQNTIPVSTVMNTTINSKAMQLQNMLFYCFQIVFTGTPTGSFKLQGSADNSATMTAAGQAYAPTNWTDIPSTTQAVTTAGSVLLRDPGYYAEYNFVRAVYIDTSGGMSTAIITSSTFNTKG
jgi:hypothetical protein